MSNQAAKDGSVFYIEFGFSTENIVGRASLPQYIDEISNYTLENPAYFAFYLIAAIIAFISALFGIWCFTFEYWIWNRTPNLPRHPIEMNLDAKKHSQ